MHGRSWKALCTGCLAAAAILAVAPSAWGGVAGFGYAPAVNYATDADANLGGPGEVVAGQLNAGSNLDLVTANFYKGTISVLFGNGSGTFGGRSDFTVKDPGLLGNPGPSDLALGDIDGDGDQDVVTANAEHHNVAI